MFPWTSAPPQLTSAPPPIQSEVAGMDQYNLNLWQQYQQQYAQWNAQYGEQFRKEMAAKHGASAVNIPGYSAPIAYGAAAPVTSPASVGIAAAIAQPPPPPPPEEDRPPAPGEQASSAQSNDTLQKGNFHNNDNVNWSDNTNTQNARALNERNQPQSWNSFPQENNQNRNNNHNAMNAYGTPQNRHNQSWSNNQRYQQRQGRNYNDQNQQNQNWGHNQNNRGRNQNSRGRNFMGNQGRNWNENFQNQNRPSNQGNDWIDPQYQGERKPMGQNWDQENMQDYSNNPSENPDINADPSEDFSIAQPHEIVENPKNDNGGNSTVNLDTSETQDPEENLNQGESDNIENQNENINFEKRQNTDKFFNTSQNYSGFSDNQEQNQGNNFANRGHQKDDNFNYSGQNYNRSNNADRGQYQNNDFRNSGQRQGFANRDDRNQNNSFITRGQNQGDGSYANQNPFSGRNKNNNSFNNSFDNRNDMQSSNFNRRTPSYDNKFENHKNQRNSFNRGNNNNQGNSSQENPFNQGTSTMNDRGSYNNQESCNQENNSPEEKFFREQFRKWENDYNNWKQDNYNRLDKDTFESYQRKFEEVRSQLMEKWENMRMRKQQQNKSQNMVGDNTEASTNKEVKMEERVPTPQEQKDTFDEDYDENYTNFEKKDIEKPEMSKIFNKPDGIPGLDLVPDEEKNKDIKNDIPKAEKQSSIPSLFDIVIEKPVGFGESIEIPSDEDEDEKKVTEEVPKNDLEKSEEKSKSDIPANVLQDPKLLGMLSAALATAKSQPTSSNDIKDTTLISSASIEEPNKNIRDENKLNVTEDSQPNFIKGRQDNISDERFDGSARRFDCPRERYDGPDVRFDCSNDKFDGRVGRFDGPDGRFDKQERKFDGHSSIYDGSADRTDDLGRGFDGSGARAETSRYDGPFRFDGSGNKFSNDRFNNRSFSNNEQQKRFNDRAGHYNDGGRFEDMQNSKYNYSQDSGRFNNNPENPFSDNQRNRYNDMQGGRYNDIQNPRFNDMQGRKFDEMQGNRFADRFNSQNNRFKDMKAGRFENRERFDDRDGRGNRFNDYRANEDIRNDQRNQPRIPHFENRSRNSFEERRYDEEYFKPAKVIDYGSKPTNRFSSTDTFIPAKVIDHASSTQEPKRDQDDYFPMKTIDYSQKNVLKDEDKKPSETENTFNRKRRNEDPKHSDDAKKVKAVDDIQQSPSTNTSVLPENPKEKSAVEIKDEQIEKFTNPEAPNYPTYFGTSNALQNIEPSLVPLKTMNIKPTMSAQERKLFFEQQIADLEQNQRKHARNPVGGRFNSNNKPQNIYPSYENSNTITVNEILLNPGRLTRPKKIVIICRGPPGSGKSHVAKLMKQKEIEQGGDKSTPRILSIDDYFMIEDDVEEKCPKTGRKIIRKKISYEYDKKMEDTYMQYLIKALKKNTDNGLFKFIIIDCCNSSLVTFTEFYNIAKDAGYTPYTVDLLCQIDFCLKHNIHNRSKEDIEKMIANWNPTPFHYIKLDVSPLTCFEENVQDIIDVDMEDVSDCEELNEENVKKPDNDDGDDSDSNSQTQFEFLKSKWDDDEKKLERLDGTVKFHKRKASTMSEYLQLDDWVPTTCVKGKKRVRWADLEEKREQEKMRAIGFVVGQTDWSRMMDPTAGSGALTQTKYIEKANKGRSVR